MSFSFVPNEMEEDLLALSRVGSKFLVGQSQSRLDRFARDIKNAQAGAKTKGEKEFRWRINPDEPIQVSESRQWKGGSKNFDPLTADIHADYVCRLIEGEARVEIKGVCVVYIHNAEKTERKVVHFDVEAGGWTEIVGGTKVDRAGHPPFHVQFYGMVNDLPRLPSLVVHPVDVITLVMLELHQKGWRDHAGSTKGRSELRHVPHRQRERFGKILTTWKNLVARTDFPLALIAMQSEIQPLAI